MRIPAYRLSGRQDKVADKSISHLLNKRFVRIVG
jgi:hypothetical protein